jgi:signal recognition particle GTPase
MNPLGVKMPTNLFGFAKSSNNSPGTWKERLELMSHRAEQLNKMTEDGSLAKLIKHIPGGSHLANKAVNVLNKDRGISRG